MSAPDALLDRRRRVLGAHAPLFYDEPLQLVRGRGAWVYDQAGGTYLDAYNNVPHVGHCHPHVVAAIAAQAGELNLHTRYLHPRIVDYAERLLQRFAAPLTNVLFCCTGTEANELALRLARHCTGASGIVVTSFSYHGNSQALAALTTAFPTPEALPAEARTFALPDTLRGGQGAQQLAAGLTRSVTQAVESLQEAGLGVAALLVDASFSTEGLPELPAGALQAVGEVVRRAGGLVIADEVQGGFGRQGANFWSYEHAGLTPDLVTLGKPMGNGFPVAAVVAPAAVVDAFGPAYFNTFAGNPIAAAAADAVLDVIDGEGLQAQAEAVGARLKAELNGLRARHPMLGDIRGRGLYLGAEIVDPTTGASPDADAARRLVNRLRREGVLVGRIGPHDNVLKIRPPLVFASEHVDALVAAFERALAEPGA